MMRRWFLLALTALSAAACAPEKPAPPPVKRVEIEKPRDAFSIDLQKGCEVVDAPRSLDFAILGVKCDGGAKVGIFVGDWPNPTFDDKSLIVKPDIPGRDVVVKKEGPDKRIYGYVWKTAYDWPSQIHVWVVPDALDDAQAQAIAASLRPTVPSKTSEKGATI